MPLHHTQDTPHVPEFLFLNFLTVRHQDLSPIFSENHRLSEDLEELLENPDILTQLVKVVLDADAGFVSFELHPSVLELVLHVVVDEGPDMTVPIGDSQRN